MPFARTATVTIANGATVSGSTNLDDLKLVAIVTPAALTGTSLAFKVSLDNSTFTDLFDEDGVLYSVAVSTSRATPVNPAYFQQWSWVQVVSNAAEGGSRALTLRLHPSPLASGRVVTELPAPAALADATANPTVPTVGADMFLFNGTTWDRARGNSLFDLKVQHREVISHSVTAAVNTQTTLTLPAGGAGVFTYLTYLQIIMYATGALTGGATPVLVTTTNIPNTPSFTFPTAQAIGLVAEQKYEGALPIKGSVAATAITIVGPATASVIWRINACYFLA